MLDLWQPEHSYPTIKALLTFTYKKKIIIILFYRRLSQQAFLVRFPQNGTNQVPFFQRKIGNVTHLLSFLHTCVVSKNLSMYTHIRVFCYDTYCAVREVGLIFEEITTFGSDQYVSLTHVCISISFVLFCCFTSQVNSYAHGGMVSSPNHTFSCASLNKPLTSNSCTYFRL